MSFFKDLSKKITEGVQDATEKASELVEVQKLNAAINKEKTRLQMPSSRLVIKFSPCTSPANPFPTYSPLIY